MRLATCWCSCCRNFLIRNFRRRFRRLVSRGIALCLSNMIIIIFSNLGRFQSSYSVQNKHCIVGDHFWNLTLRRIKFSTLVEHWLMSLFPETGFSTYYVYFEVIFFSAIRSCNISSLSRYIWVTINPSICLNLVFKFKFLAKRSTSIPQNTAFITYARVAPRYRIIYKDLVRTSQPTQSSSIQIVNGWLQYWEILSAYCKNYTEHKNTLCSQNAEIV